MQGGESPDALRAALPGPDFQQLRRLVGAARREAGNEAADSSARRLFRFLRDRGMDAPDESGAG